MTLVAKDAVPILLLKTKSTPADVYDTYFTALDGASYEPIFVPVLEHQFKEEALDQVRHCITSRDFLSSSRESSSQYGAIVFTSQRAVEAFTSIIEKVRADDAYSLDELLPGSVPFYVVGPATARGLRALGLQCPILGEESGNGDTLSSYILEHYNSIHPGPTKPSILFLVGEKRRDIIPRTLQSEELALERRTKVDELEVYETREMLSFKDSFTSIWQKNLDDGVVHQWVVVFSPTGCKAMLESLNLLDKDTGRIKKGNRPQGILIATIGPTTRDYLVEEFGFSPDVCAKKPSPGGVAEGIRSFFGVDA